MLYSELLTCGSEEEKTLSRAELKAVVEVLAAVFSALAASLSEVEVAEIELPTVRRLLRLVAALVFCCVKIASASDPPGTFPSPAFCSWVRIWPWVWLIDSSSLTTPSTRPCADCTAPLRLAAFTDSLPVA